MSSNKYNEPPPSYPGYPENATIQQQPGIYPAPGSTYPTQQLNYPQSNYPQQIPYTQGTYPCTQQQVPYPQGGYPYTQQQSLYPQSTYPFTQQPGPYPQGTFPYARQQGPHPQGDYPYTPPVAHERQKETKDCGVCGWCLASMAALLCGCLVGQCTGTDICCCLIPIPCPPFKFR